MDNVHQGLCLERVKGSLKETLIIHRENNRILVNLLIDDRP
jgi:hypothetical protein